eukprot:scaffold112325_cov19-Tisochrysis_lutea.AAC.1
METELPCASAKPQQLLDNGTNEDAAKSCNDKENRDGNKEDEGEDAPKLLADLVEAVLGGVLIDCDGGGGRGLVAAWNAYCGLARAAGMDRDLRLERQCAYVMDRGGAGYEANEFMMSARKWSPPTSPTPVVLPFFLRGHSNCSKFIYPIESSQSYTGHGRHIGSQRLECPSPKGKKEASMGLNRSGGFLAALGPKAPELSCVIFNGTSV